MMMMKMTMMMLMMLMSDDDDDDDDDDDNYDDDDNNHDDDDDGGDGNSNGNGDGYGYSDGDGNGDDDHDIFFNLTIDEGLTVGGPLYNMIYIVRTPGGTNALLLCKQANAVMLFIWKPETANYSNLTEFTLHV